MGAKRSWLSPACFCAILLTLALSAYGLSNRWLHTGPTLQIDPVVDLGTVDPNSQLTVPVEVRNVGTEELRLFNITSSCQHCLFVNRATDKGVEAARELILQPGESKQFLVTLVVTAKGNQPYEGRFWFQTNDARRPECSVRLYASVRGGPVCYPPELLLGEVTCGSTVQRRVQVRNTGRVTPYRFSRVEIPGEASLQARIVPHQGITKDPNAEHLGPLVAEIELSGTIPVTSAGSRELRVELFEESRDQPLVVPVRYTVREEYQVTPSALVLPRSSNGSFNYTAQLLVRLSQPSSGGALKVRELPPGLSVVQGPEYHAAEAGHLLVVRYDPQQEGAARTGKTSLRFDLPLGDRTKTIEVPITIWSP